jgi:hypothetical protein
MKMSLKQTRIGRSVISMVMFMMLVLSPVSSSHASLHGHEGAKSSISDEGKTQHSNRSNDHHEHQNIGYSDDHMNGTSEDTHSSADMCCSAFCTTAIIAVDFISNGLRYSQCEFHWRPAPMLIGELSSPHRPPDA